MGYYVISKKVNVTLNVNQQKEIFKIWDSIESSKKLKTLHLEYFLQRINAIENKSITDFLDELNFTYEKKGENLKLKDFEGKLSYQSELFEKIAHIVTVGNHITLRGEDGAIFGWFFDGGLKRFNSYAELKELQKPFMLHQKLNVQLEMKPAKIVKVKI